MILQYFSKNKLKIQQSLLIRNMLLTDQFQFSDQNNSYEGTIVSVVSQTLQTYLQKIVYFIENNGCLADLEAKSAESEEVRIV